MHKMIMFLGLALLLTVMGCALANKIAPSQLDASGNPIPGTHDVSQPIHSTAATIPYGEAVIGVILLAWNGFEKFKSYKLGKGLTATVQAIEKVASDPTIVASEEKLKEALSHAHDVANVQPLIKDVLSKI